MINLQELQRWRYYFIDLPLWVWGIKTHKIEKRLFKMFEPEIPSFRDGITILFNYLNIPIEDSEVEGIITKAFWVKVIREGDAFASLLMSKNRLNQYFQIEGIDHLESAVQKNRPIIILTGHFGSFFIPSIAFSHAGFDVYPIARVVDHSPATPPATRFYQKLNYFFSEKRFSARYIYTDFAGKIDRDIISISNKGGIFWVALDFPMRLYPYKHHPVVLFGRNSTLPSGIVQWGIKRNAVFLTAWNCIEEAGKKNFYRLLTIDEPFPEGIDLGAVLQNYANRLEERVTRQPWQWAALPVIKQYEATAEIRND